MSKTKTLDHQSFFKGGFLITIEGDDGLRIQGIAHSGQINVNGNDWEMVFEGSPALEVSESKRSKRRARKVLWK